MRPEAGQHVRWTTRGDLAGASPFDVHTGRVLWSALMPPGPRVLAEAVAILARLRREKRPGVPTLRGLCTVGRGTLVEVLDQRGRTRIFAPWVRRLEPDDRTEETR